MPIRVRTLRSTDRVILCMDSLAVITSTHTVNDIDQRRLTDISLSQLRFIGVLKIKINNGRKTRKEGYIIKYKSLLALNIIERGTGEKKC